MESTLGEKSERFVSCLQSLSDVADLSAILNNEKLYSSMEKIENLLCDRHFMSLYNEWGLLREKNFNRLILCLVNELIDSAATLDFEKYFARKKDVNHRKISLLTSVLQIVYNLSDVQFRTLELYAFMEDLVVNGFMDKLVSFVQMSHLYADLPSHRAGSVLPGHKPDPQYLIISAMKVLRNLAENQYSTRRQVWYDLRVVELLAQLRENVRLKDEFDEEVEKLTFNLEHISVVDSLNRLVQLNCSPGDMCRNWTAYTNMLFLYKNIERPIFAEHRAFCTPQAQALLENMFVYMVSSRAELTFDCSLAIHTRWVKSSQSYNIMHMRVSIFYYLLRILTRIEHFKLKHDLTYLNQTIFTHAIQLLDDAIIDKSPICLALIFYFNSIKKYLRINRFETLAHVDIIYKLVNLTNRLKANATEESTHAEEIFTLYWVLSYLAERQDQSTLMPMLKILIGQLFHDMESKSMPILNVPPANVLHRLRTLSSLSDRLKEFVYFRRFHIIRDILFNTRGWNGKLPAVRLTLQLCLNEDILIELLEDKTLDGIVKQYTDADMSNVDVKKTYLALSWLTSKQAFGDLSTRKPNREKYSKFSSVEPNHTRRTVAIITDMYGDSNQTVAMELDSNLRNNLRGRIEHLNVNMNLNDEAYFTWSSEMIEKSSIVIVAIDQVDYLNEYFQLLVLHALKYRSKYVLAVCRSKQMYDWMRMSLLFERKFFISVEDQFPYEPVVRQVGELLDKIDAELNRKNNVLEWNEHDVDAWFKQNNINQFIRDAYANSTGKDLAQIYNIKQQYGKLFYKQLASDTQNRINLKDIAAFSRCLDDLFTRNYPAV